MHSPIKIFLSNEAYYASHYTINKTVYQSVCWYQSEENVVNIKKLHDWSFISY